MKIVAISDTHRKHDEIILPDGDILIHCGDATNSGKYVESLEFIYWFNKQHFKYKILVKGNHDKSLKGHDECINLLDKLGIIVLNDSSINIAGLNIYGNSHTPYFRDGINQVLDKEESAWSNLPENLDILITHCPPLGVLDYTYKNVNMGSVGLQNKLMSLMNRPKIHVFGHIHENGGNVIDNLGIVSYNVSCVNLKNEVVKPYQII